MIKTISAFDDFLDQCLLEDDSLCKDKNPDLNQVIMSLLSINQKEWEAFEDLAT